jgi:hypothetical protein
MRLFDPKSKKDVLTRLLREKRLPGEVFFDSKRHAWMHTWKTVGGEERLDRLGHFVDAIILIMKNDYLAEHWEKSLLADAKRKGLEAGKKKVGVDKNPYDENRWDMQFRLAWASGYLKGLDAR